MLAYAYLPFKCVGGRINVNVHTFMFTGFSYELPDYSIFALAMLHYIVTVFVIVSLIKNTMLGRHYNLVDTQQQRNKSILDTADGEYNTTRSLIIMLGSSLYNTAGS